MTRMYKPIPKTYIKLLDLIKEVYELGVCQGLIGDDGEYTNNEWLLLHADRVLKRTWNDLDWRGRLVIRLAETYGEVEEVE